MVNNGKYRLTFLPLRVVKTQTTFLPTNKKPIAFNLSFNRQQKKPIRNGTAMPRQ